MHLSTVCRQACGSKPLRLTVPIRPSMVASHSPRASGSGNEIDVSGGRRGSEKLDVTDVFLDLQFATSDQILIAD